MFGCDGGRGEADMSCPNDYGRDLGGLAGHAATLVMIVSEKAGSRALVDTLAPAKGRLAARGALAQPALRREQPWWVKPRRRVQRLPPSCQKDIRS
jgi:hypothetical protein